MVDMGFDPDTAARALNSTRGNREAATAILLGEASQDSTVATSDPNAGLLGSLRTIGGKALAHAKSLDDKYKITDKVVEVTTPGNCLFPSAFRFPKPKILVPYIFKYFIAILARSY